MEKSRKIQHSGTEIDIVLVNQVIYPLCTSSRGGDTFLDIRIKQLPISKVSIYEDDGLEPAMA